MEGVSERTNRDRGRGKRRNTWTKDSLHAWSRSVSAVRPTSYLMGDSLHNNTHSYTYTLHETHTTCGSIMYACTYVHACTCTCSGGRALTAKIRGPRFNPGWLPVFHGSLKIFPSLSSCIYIHVRRYCGVPMVA